MGNPFVHVELATDNLDSAKQFYAKLFNWKLKDMPEMSYTMIEVGEGVGGGMMVKPMPEVPNMWLPYVQVADVEKTTQQAAALGGVVIVPRTPIPGMGAFGVIKDPTGAGLGIFEMAPPPPKPAVKKAEKKPAKKAPKKQVKKAVQKQVKKGKKGKKR